MLTSEDVAVMHGKCIRLIGNFCVGRGIHGLERAYPDTVNTFAVVLAFYKSGLSSKRVDRSTTLCILSVASTRLSTLYRINVVRPSKGGKCCVRSCLTRGHDHRRIRGRHGHANRGCQGHSGGSGGSSSPADRRAFAANRSIIGQSGRRGAEAPRRLSGSGSAPPAPSGPSFNGLLSHVRTFCPAGEFSNGASRSHVRLRIS